jgi:hypothetical protein
VTDDEHEFELESIIGALEDLAGKELRNNLKLNPWRSGKDGVKARTIDPASDDDEAQELYDVAKSETDVDVGSSITKLTERNEDLDKMKNWATRHKNGILAGNLDSRPRDLGTLAVPKSVTADI